MWVTSMLGFLDRIYPVASSRVVDLGGSQCMLTKAVQIPVLIYMQCERQILLAPLVTVFFTPTLDLAGWSMCMCVLLFARGGSKAWKTIGYSCSYLQNPKPWKTIGD